VDVEIRPSSVGGDAALRLAADVGAAAMGFATGVITARALGPDGKGTLAVIAFLLGLFGPLGTLGLGEVAVVWFGRKRLSLQATFSRILPPAVAGAVIGALGFVAIAAVTLEGGENVRLAIAAGAAGVVVSSLGLMGTSFLNTVHEFGVINQSLLAGSTATAILTALLVIVAPLEVLGATLAIAGGGLIAAVPVFARLRRRGVRPRPAVDAGFLREAIPYGGRVLIGGTFITLTGRLDVFLVYTLDGQSAAGYYSVGLTVASVAAMAPLALAYVVFPRFAAAGDAEARELTTTTARQTLVLAAAVGLALAAISPFLVPLAFGADFEDSVGPTLVLLAGYVLSSLQWVLGRSLAARGAPQVMARSWGVTLLAMVVADVPLILTLGAIGAAIGWTLATCLGLAVCIAYQRREWGADLLRDLVPRGADVRLTWGRTSELVATVVRRLRGRDRRG